MFNKINLTARFYDPLLGGPLKPLRLAILISLPENKDCRILDLCCGTGDQLRLLERAGYKDLHGLDLDPGMISFAKTQSAGIDYIVGDASETGLPDASFDVITISLALHDKDQALREAILREAARLIKPDGHILAADFAFDDRTKFMGRFLITAVEGFAGGEHYRNFKDYRKRGGMRTILPKNMFNVKEIARVLKNGIGVWKLSAEH
jgi:demethylmenaquinone methyltransferase/2-methoxy-6-polyprenyl-1,4-benzoquinol methylase